MVHHKFLPQDRKVNKEYYLEVMRQLREAIRQKCTELWLDQSWTLRHDNAPSHTSMLVYEVFGQAPYLSDFAQADFFLLLKLKTTMKEKRFATI